MFKEETQPCSNI